MILAKEQRIGAIIIISIAFIAWFVVAFWPQDEQQAIEVTDQQPKKYRTWEERKDSMKRADSLRYAAWTKEREQRYDSFKLANSIGRQNFYDSIRIADSLWRDSMGIKYVKRIKKDTVLDLNHTDTAQLQLIRGIGSYSARRIVSYGKQLGGYCHPIQLTDSALGNLHLDTLLTHFIADTSAIQKIAVNSCSVERLRQHPYLRYSQAKAIYSLRRKMVKLNSINDLLQLHELDPKDIERLKPYLSFQ